MSDKRDRMDKWETFSRTKSLSSSSESGASRITIGLHAAYFDGSCHSSNQAACVSGLSSTDSYSKHESSDFDSCDAEVSDCKIYYTLSVVNIMSSNVLYIWCGLIGIKCSWTVQAASIIT